MWCSIFLVLTTVLSTTSVVGIWTLHHYGLGLLGTMRETASICNNY
jgi:hypothetical protein